MNKFISVRAVLSHLLCIWLVSAPDPHVTPSRKRVWYQRRLDMTQYYIIITRIFDESATLRP